MKIFSERILLFVGKMKRRLRPFLFYTVLLLAIYYLGKNFLNDLEKVGESKFLFEFHSLAIALVFFSFMFLTQSFVALFILDLLGYKIDTFHGVKSIFISSLGKYIPGKVGVVLFRMHKLSELQVPKKVVFLAMVIEHLFLIPIGAAFGSLSVFSFSRSSLLLPTLIVSAMFLFFLVSMPNTIIRLIMSTATRFGHETYVADITRLSAIKISLFTCVNWFFFSLGTWYCTGSIVESSPPPFFPIAGAYALSVLGGFAAIFSPGGIGVRESLFVLIAPFDTKGLLVIWSILLRLVSSASEIASLVIVQSCHMVLNIAKK